jgi:transketolase
MNTAELKEKAAEIRRSILISLAYAGSGHTGGSLGMADIFTALYFEIMNHRPHDPRWTGRDRLVLSIGHIAPVLYATLAHSGYFDIEELKTLRKLGSRLQGHPGRDHGLPGIELSAGSLGQGLSVATGMAIAAKHKNENHRIFCISGDGELQEGSIWEAAMSAAHHNLDNIIWIIDRNELQIDGNTEKVMRLEPLSEKFKAFGWEVFQCNGNDIDDFISTFKSADKITDKPKVIIARTIMGKGIAEIENNAEWHGKAPSFDELKRWGIAY